MSRQPAAVLRSRLRRMLALRRHLARRAHPVTARARLLRALLDGPHVGVRPGQITRRPPRLAPLARVLRRAAWVVRDRGTSLRWSLHAILGARPQRPLPGAAPRTGAARSALVERISARERWVLVQRATQTQRIERHSELRTATATRHTTLVHPTHRLAGMAPVPLTMARAAPAPAARDDAWNAPPVAAAPALPDAAPAQRRPARAAPEVSLPPQELSRVTEHVIRQLDRRVLSYQERTGRI
jgi:hypothetical protein